MPPQNKKPIILLAFANATQDPLPSLGDEHRMLCEILKKAEFENLWQVETLPFATLHQIIDFFQDARYRNRVKIFHFAGHANGLQLFLESETGKNRPAYSRGLAGILGEQRGLQLVFLNACTTQQQVSDLFEANVPSVIATSRKIGDEFAVEFATRFYKGLVGWANIRTAYKEAAAEFVAKLNQGDLPWKLHRKKNAVVSDDWSLPRSAPPIGDSSQRLDDRNKLLWNWDFFIAHSNADEAIAKELFEQLKSSWKVFLNVNSISAGEPWGKITLDAQRSSAATIVLLSDNWEQAHYLREEIAIAIALMRASNGSHKVIPVYLSGRPLDVGAQPYGLHSLQYIDAQRDDVSSRLIEIIQGHRGLANRKEVDSGKIQHPLHAYPRGPFVQSHLIPTSIIDAFAALIPASQAPLVLDQVIAARIEADPFDSSVTYVKHADLPPPATVAPRVYWQAAFTEARLHGPRMLAALLMAIGDERLAAKDRNEQQKLLKYLRTHS